MDLVPRLTVPGDVQEFFRQEFQRVSARHGMLENNNDTALNNCMMAYEKYIFKI